MDAPLTQADVQFTAPTSAAEIRPLPARLFLVVTAMAGIACALGLHGDALWPTPAPLVSVVAMSLLIAIAARVGAYRQIEGLAEFTSLAMPITFATLLVLNWSDFAIAMVVAELFSYLGDVASGSDVTIWYVRVFNVTVLLVAGALSTAVLSLAHPSAVFSTATWASPALALTLLVAALVWKLVDGVATSVLLNLAAGRSVREIGMPMRAFVAQFGLFLVAIPFAWVWHENVWLSLFTLTSLGAASRLLGVPELEHRARTDGLSGLANRQSFDEFLEAEIDAAPPAKPTALLALDIDHFKKVNDTFGHLIGDAVIAQLGRVLANVARREDLAARTGGEEFSIFLRDSDRQQAGAFAERLRRVIEAETFTADGLAMPLSITVSIGVAVYPESGRSARELRRAADAALYAAKDAGRNVIQLAKAA